MSTLFYLNFSELCVLAIYYAAPLLLKLLAAEHNTLKHKRQNNGNRRHSIVPLHTAWNLML